MRLLASVLAELTKTNPAQRRFLGHLLGLLLRVPGRVTFRNLSRYSDYEEKTFRRWFAREVDGVALNRVAIEQVVPAAHAQVLAFDPSFIPKSGKRTYGLERFWNSTHSRVEKGLEIQTVAWLDVNAHAAYHLSTAQTPPDSVMDPAHSRIDAYLQHLRPVIAALGAGPLKYLAVDGYFAKKKFIAGVCALGWHVVGKLRTDAHRRYLYTGPRRPGRGRPKRYAGKVDLRERSGWEYLPTTDPRYGLYHAVLNAVHFHRDLQVVLVVDTHTQRYRGLFSTDLSLSPLTLYRYYQARFQIEFLFRDAKQFTGLTDCQARSQTQLHNHFNASLTAVSLAKLDAQQLLPRQMIPFSMASRKRRYFNQHLLDRINEHLARGGSLEKFSPAYESLCNYGTIVKLAA